MTPNQPANALGRIHQVSESIRQLLALGKLTPNQKLSEGELSQQFDISRNTLREVFRLLTKEGLLKHVPNRGVFVATPSMASIIDIYRVRRMIECQSVMQSNPKHPAQKRMKAILDNTLVHYEKKDWIAIGTDNIAFHAAIVELADSERLNIFFANISAELRLAFGILNDPEYIHTPYIEMNRHLYQLIDTNKKQEAAAYLDDYLTQSERMILASYARHLDTTNT